MKEDFTDEIRLMILGGYFYQRQIKLIFNSKKFKRVKDPLMMII
jgi:hypothetical protein